MPSCAQHDQPDREGINTTHGGDVPAAFERAVRVAVENREFWRPFTDIPDIDMDGLDRPRTERGARRGAYDPRAKAAAPLDAMELSPECMAAIDAYDVHRAMVADLSDALLARNPSIAIVKEQAASPTQPRCPTTLPSWPPSGRRRAPAACDAYLAEKAAKKATEKLRDEARAASRPISEGVFPPTRPRSTTIWAASTSAFGSAPSRR
jgi:hypothetical protein